MFFNFPYLYNIYNIGHNFEFEPIRDIVVPDQCFKYPPAPGEHPRGTMICPLNQFQLQPGQFTDDTSMALCLADSLLTCGELNDSDSRCWYWNWWNNGVNNSFRYDDSRSHSVGLGGNISYSLSSISAQRRRPSTSRRSISHHYEAKTEDAGNGSLMRLAPVALRFHHDIAEARQKAYESSLATHPGPIAAEACAFLAHVIVRAIHRPDVTYEDSSSSKGSSNEVQMFLQSCVDEYIQMLQQMESTPARSTLQRLLLGREEDSSPERCWNWKHDSLMFARTLGNRGRSYNGYSVSPGYFGAFSLDGLAIALHCIYHTSSFNMAIVRVVNMFGDADSTGAIVGQIAGAYYGVRDIEPAWIEDLQRWDPSREVELRAVLLFFAAQYGAEAYTDKAGMSTVDTSEVVLESASSHTVKDDGADTASEAVTKEQGRISNDTCNKTCTIM